MHGVDQQTGLVCALYKTDWNAQVVCVAKARRQNSGDVRENRNVTQQNREPMAAVKRESLQNAFLSHVSLAPIGVAWRFIEWSLGASKPEKDLKFIDCAWKDNLESDHVV